jgi:hypothetical protein
VKGTNKLVFLNSI